MLALEQLNQEATDLLEQTKRQRLLERIEAFLRADLVGQTKLSNRAICNVLEIPLRCFASPTEVFTEILRVIRHAGVPNSEIRQLIKQHIELLRAYEKAFQQRQVSNNHKATE